MFAAGSLRKRFVELEEEEEARRRLRFPPDEVLPLTRGGMSMTICDILLGAASCFLFLFCCKSDSPTTPSRGRIPVGVFHRI